MTSYPYKNKLFEENQIHENVTSKISIGSPHYNNANRQFVLFKISAVGGQTKNMDSKQSRCHGAN